MRIRRLEKRARGKQRRIQDFVLRGTKVGGEMGGVLTGFQYYCSFSGRNFKAFLRCDTSYLNNISSLEGANVSFAPLWIRHWKAILSDMSSNLRMHNFLTQLPNALVRCHFALARCYLQCTTR